MRLARLSAILWMPKKLTHSYVGWKLIGMVICNYAGCGTTNALELAATLQPTLTLIDAHVYHIGHAGVGQDVELDPSGLSFVWNVPVRRPLRLVWTNGLITYPKGPHLHAASYRQLHFATRSTTFGLA